MRVAPLYVAKRRTCYKPTEIVEKIYVGFIKNKKKHRLKVFRPQIVTIAR